MALEQHLFIEDTHTRAITALSYNPSRREVTIGYEDGILKSFNADDGTAELCEHAHNGMVTCFLYWAECRLHFSAGVDGVLIAWSPGGRQYDKFYTYTPVYSMAYNNRKDQLIVGTLGAVKVYQLVRLKNELRRSYKTQAKEGSVIKSGALYTIKDHTDIVRNVACWEGRVFTGGYDGRLISYDSSLLTTVVMQPIVSHAAAHDAGICCMRIAKDSEANVWLYTGSFDQTFKVWTLDLKLVHRIVGFATSIMGVVYSPRTGCVWVSGGSHQPFIYEPKSGDNVSDYLTLSSKIEDEQFKIQQLADASEIGMIFASTNRRHVVTWKYNQAGCITMLTGKSPVNSLAYTNKSPILLFSGDEAGGLTKWERMQVNIFLYTKDRLAVTERERKEKLRKGQEVSPEEAQANRAAEAAKAAAKKKQSKYTHASTGILKLVYIEEIDYLIAAAEDTFIYVWAYDAEGLSALRSIPRDEDPMPVLPDELFPQRAQSTAPSEDPAKSSDESVMNRVAGFACKFVLSEHGAPVTSLCVIPRGVGGSSTVHVLSSGWDKTVCCWDIESGRSSETQWVFVAGSGLVDYMKKPTEKTPAPDQIVPDGVITDMNYCISLNHFAYSSSDHMVYVHEYALKRAEMKKICTLVGHEGEVTTVKWNTFCERWVTASEDGSIRLWNPSGDCTQTLWPRGGGPVTTLCIESSAGGIVAAVEKLIVVYDVDEFRLIQTNRGHTDAIKSVIHVAERGEYISASWDGTIRIWKAAKVPTRRASISRSNSASLPRSSRASSARDGETGEQLNALEDVLARGREDDEEDDDLLPTELDEQYE